MKKLILITLIGAVIRVAMADTFFGLDFYKLADAVGFVESDRGLSSDNVFQLRDIYIADVNRIYGTSFKSIDKFSKKKSLKMMRLYWKFYGNQYRKQTGKPVTYDVLARIHNGGPNGWAKKCTQDYAKRVRKAMR